jgi:hypothetical protein
MAVHELSAEIRELRKAIDAYARHLLQSQEVRHRLAVALEKAIPSLEREAATRCKSTAPDLGSEHFEAPGQSSTWPSPEALVDLPRKLLELLPQELGIVGRMRQVLHDLSRVDGDPRIVPRFAPTNIRMAKALDLAGCSAAVIATIIKPFAKTGAARKQARNTVLRYLTSKSEDMLLAWSIPPDAPDRAQRVKELEEALDRVMGMADAKVRRIAVSPAPDAAPDSVPSSSR